MFNFRIRQTPHKALQHLEKTIQTIKDLGIRCVLHHPIKYNNQHLDIIHRDPTMRSYYDLSTRIIAEICIKHDINCVIHPHYTNPAGSDPNDINKVNEMKGEISKVLAYSKEVFLWENSIEGLFTAANSRWVEDFVEPLQLQIVYDVSHAFISYKGDNAKLIDNMEKLAPYIKYLHVVDSCGFQHDSLRLGDSYIDWKHNRIHSRQAIYL
ncbi:hypothetical protein [Lysinibacillus sp. NPDC092081]|uniref:hypothetical protein n=1 Tax=Lysinibacillus sp. NPDC092081 TaxID=3364131 RepID=UPI00382DE6F0